MTPRCPYCHSDLLADMATATCDRCRALAHPACALELGRCAACGGAAFVPTGEPVDGWRLVRALPPGRAEAPAAYLRELPRSLPARDEAEGRVELRLDLQRREAPQDGLLAGDAVLVVPRPTVLGGLDLVLTGEVCRPGFLSRVRRERSTLRRVHLLGPERAPRKGFAYFFGSSAATGVYAPGTYRVGFRLPLEGVPATNDRPGEPHHRLHLTLELLRPGRAPLSPGIEVRVLGAPGAEVIRFPAVA